MSERGDGRGKNLEGEKDEIGREAQSKKGGEKNEERKEEIRRKGR